GRGLVVDLVRGQLGRAPAVVAPLAEAADEVERRLGGAALPRGARAVRRAGQLLRKTGHRVGELCPGRGDPGDLTGVDGLDIVVELLMIDALVTRVRGIRRRAVVDTLPELLRLLGELLLGRGV